MATDTNTMADVAATWFVAESAEEASHLHLHTCTAVLQCHVHALPGG
jgi:hypothetical protein